MGQVATRSGRLLSRLSPAAAAAAAAAVRKGEKLFSNAALGTRIGGREEGIGEEAASSAIAPPSARCSPCQGCQAFRPRPLLSSPFQRGFFEKARLIRKSVIASLFLMHDSPRLHVTLMTNFGADGSLDGDTMIDSRLLRVDTHGSLLLSAKAKAAAKNKALNISRLFRPHLTLLQVLHFKCIDFFAKPTLHLRPLFFHLDCMM